MMTTPTILLPADLAIHRWSSRPTGGTGVDVSVALGREVADAALPILRCDRQRSQHGCHDRFISWIEEDHDDLTTLFGLSRVERQGCVSALA